MKRLTSSNEEIKTLQVENEEYWLKVYFKLKEYEDLEEQGLLIRLPCKAGDTVYKLWYKPCHHGVDCPDSFDCCGCDDDCDLEKDIFEFVVPSLEWVLDHINAFGGLVWFLTREEAEAALERMSEDA